MSSNTRKSRILQGKYMNIYAGQQQFVLYEKEAGSELDSIFAESFLHHEDNGHDDHEVSLNADPYLFGLIHAHLKGYEIFPLPAQGIPYGGGYFSRKDSARMAIYLSKEAALKNLLRDATDFGLTNLVARIEQEMAKEAKAQPTDGAAMGFEMLNSNDDFELDG